MDDQEDLLSGPRKGHHVSVWLSDHTQLAMSFKGTTFCAVGKDSVVVTPRWTLSRGATVLDTIVVPNPREMFEVLKAHKMGGR